MSCKKCKNKIMEILKCLDAMDKEIKTKVDEPWTRFWIGASMDGYNHGHLSATKIMRRTLMNIFEIKGVKESEE